MWFVEGHSQNVVPGRLSVRYHSTDDARSPKNMSYLSEFSEANNR